MTATENAHPSASTSLPLLPSPHRLRILMRPPKQAPLQLVQAPQKLYPFAPNIRRRRLVDMCVRLRMRLRRRP